MNYFQKYAYVTSITKLKTHKLWHITKNTGLGTIAKPTSVVFHQQ